MQFDASMVAPVVRDTLRHFKANPRVFGLIFLASTVAGIGFDLSSTLGEAAIIYAFAFMFFNLFLQSCTIIAILHSGGLALPARRWRIASLFGIGLIGGLGTGLGLLVLVLPGLFLVGRWFLAAPILFGEDTSVSEALHASWERTEQHWLACAILGVVTFLCQMVPLVASAYLLPESESARIGTLVATNTFSQAAWLFNIAAAATFYLTIGRRAIRNEEIFG